MVCYIPLSLPAARKPCACTEHGRRGPDPKGHPKGLYLLFFTEMWERMSYYGMRALLVLFLDADKMGGWGWSTANALALYGTYTGLVYLTPIDRRFHRGPLHRPAQGGGARRHPDDDRPPAAGAARQPRRIFYAGLGFLIVGNGFFKPNISTMVGGLYAPGDGRRDGAFTIFYMGINLGAFLASACAARWARRSAGTGASAPPAWACCSA